MIASAFAATLEFKNLDRDHGKTYRQEKRPGLNWGSKPPRSAQPAISRARAFMALKLLSSSYRSNYQDWLRHCGFRFTNYRPRTAPTDAKTKKDDRKEPENLVPRPTHDHRSDREIRANRFFCSWLTHWRKLVDADFMSHRERPTPEPSGC